MKTIQELTNIERWKHVRTAYNPADLVSRGLSAKEIVSNDLWWHSPSWLSKPQAQWPEPLDVNKIQESIEVQGELKVNTVSMAKNKLTILVRGKWSR